MSSSAEIFSTPGQSSSLTFSVRVQHRYWLFGNLIQRKMVVVHIGPDQDGYRVPH